MCAYIDLASLCTLTHILRCLDLIQMQFYKNIYLIKMHVYFVLWLI